MKPVAQMKCPKRNEPQEKDVAPEVPEPTVISVGQVIESPGLSSDSRPSTR
jgi:hypothetical protein